MRREADGKLIAKRLAAERGRTGVVGNTGSSGRPYTATVLKPLNKHNNVKRFWEHYHFH